MALGTVTVAKSTNIRIRADIHRQLAIVSSVTDEDMGAIASRILEEPVAELYKKAKEALAEEDSAKRKEKR